MSKVPRYYGNMWPMWLKLAYYNHVQLILKAEFGIFCDFSCKPKCQCPIMWLCKKLPPPHELFYFGLFKFFHLHFFCVNVICKK